MGKQTLMERHRTQNTCGMEAKRRWLAHPCSV